VVNQRIVADLYLHSGYSMATSGALEIEPGYDGVYGMVTSITD
jgi:PHP family Zn ribbon phosphoesterase